MIRLNRKMQQFAKEKDYKKVEEGESSKKNEKKMHIRRKWLITKEGSTN